VARDEGFRQIEGLFLETADNEREHAKRFFSFLEGGPVEIVAAYPAGRTGSTAENLLHAAEGEHEEWTQLYPRFAAIAKEEGLDAAAACFTMIARVEKEHEERFRRLLGNVKADTVFRRETTIRWRCRNCGYVHEGPIAPGKCPACLHPQAYFEPAAENY
jgi:rubrerythrin